MASALESEAAAAAAAASDASADASPPTTHAPSLLSPDQGAMLWVHYMRLLRRTGEE